MLKRKLSIMLLLLAMLMFLAAFAATTAMAEGTTATIWTDKPDYSPAETVTIYGSGFNPEAQVNMTVARPDGSGDEWAVTSDSSGSFTTTYLLDGITGTYTVTATDGTNAATTTFTDAAHGANLNIDFTYTTHYTRTFEWTIDKSVSPDTWDLFTGDSGTSEYTIAVTKDEGTDHAWVTGTITVSNVGPPGDQPTVNFVLTVKLTESNPNNVLNTVTVDTGSNPILSVGETGTYDYSIDVPSILTEYKIITEGSVDNPKGGNPTSKQYTLTDPFAAGPTLINDEVEVTDTNGGPWTFNDDGSVSYTKTFTAPADEGTHGNTATITETGQSDGASVTVNCYALEVSKDADESWTRTYSWTIDKSADQSELTLSTGQTFSVGYSVEVDATYSDAYSVSGAISIYNPAPIDAVITDISDIISPGSITATITDNPTFPYTLKAGDTLTVHYTADLPDDSSRTNTATATLQNYDYDPDEVATVSGTTDFSGTAAIDFSSVTMTEVDESVDVSDTYAGSLDTVTAGVDTLPKTFLYSRTIGPYGTIGDYTVMNTASYVTNDVGATDSDSWTVTVHVIGSGFCAVTSRGFEDIDTFKLIFTPDVPNNPGYFRLTASNPGQFSYNVYYMASGSETFTIEIPYPFVTQGANPVHIYDHAPSPGYTPTGNDITSQFTLGGVPVTLSSYGGTFGSFATITIEKNGYTGPMYITIHLDYSLKKIAGGYSKNGDNDAIATAEKSLYPTIEDGFDYEFTVDADAFSGADSISNMNVFKHDPGFGGLVLDSNGNPVKGVKVQIYDPSGKLLATVYADEDGWYMYNYKHTGKAATYTIKLPDYNLQQSVTLKANSFAVANFQI